MRMVLRRHWGWGVKLPSRPKSRSWEVPRVPLRISPRDSTLLFPRCPRTPNCKSMWNVQSASSSSSRQTYWRSTWSCTMERRRNSVPSVRNPSTPTITLKLTWGLTLTWSPSAVLWRFVQNHCKSNLKLSLTLQGNQKLKSMSSMFSGLPKRVCRLLITASPPGDPHRGEKFQMW